MTRKLQIATAAALLVIACIALLAGTLATGFDPTSPDEISWIADDDCAPPTLTASPPSVIVVHALEPIASIPRSPLARSIVALAPKTSPPRSPLPV